MHKLKLIVHTLLCFDLEKILEQEDVLVINLVAPRCLVPAASGPYVILVSPVGDIMYSFSKNLML